MSKPSYARHRAGFFAPAMKEEMVALDARRSELQVRLEEAPAEALMALHPGLAGKSASCLRP